MPEAVTADIAPDTQTPLGPQVESGAALLDAPSDRSVEADTPTEPPHPFDDPADKEARDTFTRGRKPARKDKATPADVPVIKELSSLIRTLKSPADADAPRVQALKKQLREALEIPDVPVKAESSKEAVAPSAAPLHPPQPFTDKEPALDDFAGQEDPYLAHARALAAYDRRKEAADAQQAWYQQEAQRLQQAAEREHQQKVEQFQQRVTAAKASKYPDWDTVVAGKDATALLNEAILGLPNGEDAIYYLGKHSDVLDELNLQSYALPRTPHSVALLQRRLSARLTAGPTGAAPTRPVLVAPRPPTPVRTAPMTTAEPADDDSDDLDAHARKYGIGGRRRR